MFSPSRKNINKKEFEYNKTRSVSKKKEGFKLLRYIYRIFFYFLVLVFVGVAFYVVFFSPFLVVRKVKIEGLKKIGLPEVTAVVKNIYDGKYLGILPKNNFVLFPKKEIASILEDNFKRIKSVEVQRKFPDSVAIHIEERDSLLLWCDKAEQCFIVDENGFAYHNVKLDSKEVLENNLMRVVSQEDRNIAEGEKVSDSEKVGFLMSAKQTLQEKAEIEIVGEVQVKSRIAEEVTFKSPEGWDILASTSFPLEKAGKFLKLFLDKKLSSEDRIKLEYVDLRVENRIYYKFKKEEIPQEGKVAEEDENQDK